MFFASFGISDASRMYGTCNHVAFPIQKSQAYAAFVGHHLSVLIRPSKYTPMSSSDLFFASDLSVMHVNSRHGHPFMQLDIVGISTGSLMFWDRERLCPS